MGRPFPGMDVRAKLRPGFSVMASRQHGVYSLLNLFTLATQSPEEGRAKPVTKLCLKTNGGKVHGSGEMGNGKWVMGDG